MNNHQSSGQIISEKRHLEQLPADSGVREIRTASKFVFWNAGDGVWCIPADDTSYCSADIHLPARVLDVGAA